MKIYLKLTMKTIVSRLNEMIDWTVKNNIPKGMNVILKIYKTPISTHIEYCTYGWPRVTRHRKRNIILKLEGTERRVTKLIKRVNDCSEKKGRMS